MGKKEKIVSGTDEVICQKWEERERGWGVRPDGFSLHISDQVRLEYIQDYWDGMPDAPPSIYESPCGTPYTTTVTIEVYEELVALKSLRFPTGYEYPGDGGTDGWLPRT